MIINTEKEIIDYIKKHYLVFCAAIVVVFSIIVRLFYINTISFDLSNYNLKWFEYIQNNGGIFALKNNIEKCNYTPAYLLLVALLSYIKSVKPLYLLKIVSIVFDFVIAYISGKIVSEFSNNKKNSKLLFFITFSIMLLLPTVVLNSSCWGQCDSIYAAFVLIALYALLHNEYFKSFVFLGLAFCFKLQFIFIIPVFLIYYFKEKKFSIIYFLLIPLIYLISCLPSIILGRSVLDCLSVYFLQVQQYSYAMSYNIANIYSLIPNFDGLSYISFFVFALIMLILLIATCLNKKSISNEDIIDLSLLSVSVAVFLLPCMHDRYLYLGDVLSIIWFAVKRKNIFVPLVINFISLNAYCYALFDKTPCIGQNVSSIMYLVIIVYLIWQYLLEMHFIPTKNKQ